MAALGMPDEIIMKWGYNVINDEEGNYDEMTKRNACFSRIRIREFVMAPSSTQSGSETRRTIVNAMNRGQYG